MRSVRLTESMRCAIRGAMIAHRFKAEEEQLKRDERELALAVYHDIYPDKLRALLNQVPADFLHHSESVLVSFAGEMKTVNFGDRLPVKREPDRYRCAAKVYAEGEPLTVRYAQLKERDDRLKAQMSEARASTKAILWSVTTINKLIAVWPEAEPFAAPYNSTQGDATAVRALTVPLPKLNALLGLPKKD